MRQLTHEETLHYFNKLKEIKAAYSALIDQRIKDIAVGIDKEGEKVFQAEEKRLNELGIAVRKKLGIQTTGEAMDCRECGLIFPALRKANYGSFFKCKQHKGKHAFRI